MKNNLQTAIDPHFNDTRKVSCLQRLSAKQYLPALKQTQVAFPPDGWY